MKTVLINPVNLLIIMVIMVANCADIPDDVRDQASGNYRSSDSYYAGVDGDTALVSCIVKGVCWTIAKSGCDYYISEHGATSVPNCGRSSSSSGRSSSGGGCSNYTYGSSTSLPYMGQTYETVRIGCQVWMAENFNYNVSGSRCFNDDDNYCDKYGRLYTWDAAKQACPSGWRLPSKDDWEELRNFADGNDGRRLKASSDWNGCGVGSAFSCDDTYGFSALPGGYSDSESFFDIGYLGNWWSSDEADAGNAYARQMSFFSDIAFEIPSNKSLLFSVRCIQGW